MNRLHKIFLFLFLAIFIFSCSNQKPDRKLLYDHGKFAIGTYHGRTVKDSITESIYYQHEVEGKVFEQFDMECFNDSEKASDHFYFTKYPLLKGNLFVVLYDSINPENSIIRLDYPLRDSIDFKSNIRKIEKERLESKDKVKSEK